MQAEVRLAFGSGSGLKPRSPTPWVGKASRKKSHSPEEARGQESVRLNTHLQASRPRERGWIWGRGRAHTPWGTGSSPLHSGPPAQPPSSWGSEPTAPIGMNH